MASVDLYQVIITVLFSISAYFIKRLLNKNDELADKVNALISDVALLKERLSPIGSLSDKFQITRDDVKEAEKRITILERDQQTIWKNIDEIKERI